MCDCSRLISPSDVQCKLQSEVQSKPPTRGNQNFHPANDRLQKERLKSSRGIGTVRYSALESMAANPLESLMSVAVNHQLICSAAAEPQSRQPSAAANSSPASPSAHRQSARSSREARKWVLPVCGPRSSLGPNSASGLQARALRSQHSPENAARERSRVRNLRQAFHSLQAALPSVPPDTKLSKLDVLVLATNYIAYLTETLDQGGTLAEHTLPSRPGGYLHPVKKWPMRSLLYCGSVGELLTGVATNQTSLPGRDGTRPLSPTSEADKD